MKKKLEKEHKSNLIFKFPNGDQLYAGEVRKIKQGELTIQKFKSGYEVASRTSIINHLIEVYKYNSYLEIGVRDGKNFDKIKIKNKIGVDPDPLIKKKNVLSLTSDNFFNNNKNNFDIIFIDGLHLETQVDRDIKNSLNLLNKNGMIVMHDCNPPTKFHQREKYEVNGAFPDWNGTTWRSFAKLRINEENLKMYCVDCDWGVGIITKGRQNLYKTNKSLTYNLLEKERKELLNLISVKNFLQKFI